MNESAPVADPFTAVMKAYAAIAAHGDDTVFISLKSEDSALAEARALATAGPAGKPLAGLVFAVKDNIDVAGLPTTAGCPAFAYTPGPSAVAVARLEAAGAIAIGKTNLDQFATGLVGVRSPYGVPRNAQRDDLIPGGSSSGSAVAVAARLVDFALGTDTAGSGRIPAGMNAIVGAKPSLGMVSGTGMVPACRTLDTISVFARTVGMAARALEVMAAYDHGDPYSRRFATPVPGRFPTGLRMGVPLVGQRAFFGDSHGEAAYDADLSALAALGAEIVAIDFAPFFEAARLLYEGPWVAERYVATRGILDADPEAMHPVTRAIISGGKGLTAASAFEAMYRLAALKREASAVMARVDVLAVPTVPRFYSVAEVEAEPILLNSRLGTYTNFVNLLDLAALALPMGRRGDGLRSGLTLIGPSGSDGHLLGLGLAIAGEETVPRRAGPGRIEIAVVGAHLTGLPLNGDLVRAGGVFLREVETVPDYRLFALPGTTPPKPGLVRVGAGEGHAIAAEVWSLDAAAFGGFVAAIPAPLSIGTLRFGDGTASKGFLVEAEATRSAPDVSAHGGWRAYLAHRASPAAAP